MMAFLMVSVAVFALLFLGWCLCGGFHHFVEDFFEIFQTGSRNDDRIAASTDIFGDAEEAAAGIFLEREDKRFALDLHFVRLQRVLVYRRFGRVRRAVRTVPVR